MRRQDDPLRVSQTLLRLMQNSLDWVFRKLEAEEGFSAIMLSEHPEGTKASLYKLASVEKALAQSESELKHALRDATAYAITYDAWLEADGGRVPILICRAEEAGMTSAHEFGLPYQIQTAQGRTVTKPQGQIRYLGSCGFKILAP